MPKVIFTKEDLLSGRKLKPGWRLLKIKDTSEKPGKNDPESTTWPTTFVVQGGEDDGTPIRVFFSEKFMAPLGELLSALVPAGVEPGKSFELDQMVGRTVQGFCGYDIKTGFNTISEFKAAPKGVSA